MTGSYLPVQTSTRLLTLTAEQAFSSTPPSHQTAPAAAAAPLLRPTGDTPGYPGPAPVRLSGHLKSAQSPRTQRPGGSSPPRVAFSQGTCGGWRAAGQPGAGGGRSPARWRGEGGTADRGAEARPAAPTASPRSRGVRPGLPWLPPARERRIARRPLVGGGGGASDFIGFRTHPSGRRWRRRQTCSPDWP